MLRLRPVKPLPASPHHLPLFLPSSPSPDLPISLTKSFSHTLSCNISPLSLFHSTPLVPGFPSLSPLAGVPCHGLSVRSASPWPKSGPASLLTTTLSRSFSSPSSPFFYHNPRHLSQHIVSSPGHISTLHAWTCTGSALLPHQGTALEGGRGPGGRPASQG